MTKKYYSIGEVSKLYNITTQTLRFYDKINLFKPEYINPKNSYRYYSQSQFEKLTMINYLRSLEMPIEDIKEHFLKKRENTVIDFFKQELEKTKNKIKEFEEIRLKLEEEIVILQNQKNFNRVETRYFKERITDFQVINNSTIEAMHESFRILKNRNHHIERQCFGTVIAENSLKSKKLDFHSTFIFIENEKYLAGIPYILPEGEYAYIISTGHREEQKKALETITSWIEKKKYNINGDAIFILLSQNHEKDKKIVYEIQVPVKT
jgi:DNA-binding transcriptional MerR regulator